MERHGYIRDSLDVKVLILYVMSLTEAPVTAQTIYELCYQDELLSYFDVQESIPQLVSSGHLERVGETYSITDKGRETQEITQDSIAYSVMQRAKRAVEWLNRNTKREQMLRTEILERDDGECALILGLDDPMGSLMDLELTVPNMLQARKLEAAYRKNAEAVYQAVMGTLLDVAEG